MLRCGCCAELSHNNSNGKGAGVVCGGAVLAPKDKQKYVRKSWIHSYCAKKSWKALPIRGLGCRPSGWLYYLPILVVCSFIAHAHPVSSSIRTMYTAAAMQKKSNNSSSSQCSWTLSVRVYLACRVVGIPAGTHTYTPTT